jgi:nitrous oxide reductase
MKQQDKPVSANRRDFLRVASVGAVAGAAMAVAGGGEAEAAAVAEVTDGKAGYRETPHVKTFYKLARY